MGLPATKPGSVLLVFLNGIKQSADGDYEIRGRYIRFSFQIMAGDRLSFITLGSDPWETEVETPYSYEADNWFDPTNFHDPAVKKLEAPPLTVTQL